MKNFRIYNTESGVELGIYSADTEEEALDVMAIDAGYVGFKESCEVVGSDGSDIVVEEVEDKMYMNPGTGAIASLEEWIEDYHNDDPELWPGVSCADEVESILTEVRLNPLTKDWEEVE